MIHANKFSSPIFNQIPRNEKEYSPVRKLGMGQLPGTTVAEKRDSLIRFIKGTCSPQCPTYNIPVIDSVTLHFDGPLTPTQIQGTFSNIINPLGASTESLPPGCVQVDTTFAEPGKFQTFVMILAIQWRLDIEDVMFTLKGNSFAPAPGVGVTAPISPDAFNAIDQVVTTGSLGLTAGQTLLPANLEWGYWLGEAMFHMVRGYNLQWQYGHNFNLLNDTLRYTAYLPSNSQDGSASNSDVDVDFYVRRTNNYYRNFLAFPNTFLKFDRTRIGNMTLNAIAGQSVYRPTRAYDTVGATFGGSGLRNALRGNNEFRRLAAPFVAWPGAPLGLKAVQASSDDALLMQNYLDATYGFGGVNPARFTEDLFINTGAQTQSTAVIGAEPSLDTPIAAQANNVNHDRTIYKGGGFKITVAFKGFELTPDQASLCKDLDLRSAIASETGCGMGVFGA